jgi:hypothetical protein
VSRTIAACLCALLAGGVASSCGGSPVGPGTNQPPPAQVNQPPTIDSIALGVDRAEVGDEVTVSATVRDAETPVSDLRYAWSADGGTFVGEGASVRWRAPSDRLTPADYTMRLTVTETYGVPDAAGVRPANVVTGSSAGSVRVHNSPKEIGDMSLGFLREFATSAIPANIAVSDFSDSCKGKADELDNVSDNRKYYEILSSSLTLVSSGMASSRLTGNAKVACSFTSFVKACQPDRAECRVGSTERVEGDCVLTAVYEQRRWWLCDSHFENGVALPAARAFFGEHR